MQAACSRDALIRSSVLLEIKKIETPGLRSFRRRQSEFASKLALKSIEEARDMNRAMAHCLAVTILMIVSESRTTSFLS